MTKRISIATINQQTTNTTTNTQATTKKGNPADKPILKNLDGMSGRYPKWIKQDSNSHHNF